MILEGCWWGLKHIDRCPWETGMQQSVTIRLAPLLLWFGRCEGEKGRLTRTSGGKCGSSMTRKQNRGSPASPTHPPWLHRNTRAMPTLQTHSSPLSSATLHYPVLSQAQRGSAPLSPHYSHVPACSLPARLPIDPGRVYSAPPASGHTHCVKVQRRHWEICTQHYTTSVSAPIWLSSYSQH